MNLNLCQFANEAEAIATPIISDYYLPPDLPPSDPDYLPGAWNGTPQIGITVTLDGVTQTGFWMVVPNNLDVADQPYCRLSWDNESAVVLGGTYTGNEIALLSVSPVLAGAYNPWPA